MRTIAFDIGTVRIGVAISDALGMIASPLETFLRTGSAEADAKELADLARLHDVGRIVVGLPISLRGEEEIAAGHVREFIELAIRLGGVINTKAIEAGLAAGQARENAPVKLEVKKPLLGREQTRRRRRHR